MAAEKRDLTQIVKQFRIDGDFLGAEPYGSGHINETYAARFRPARGETRYILQRINHGIFLEPEKLMENVVRVTAHLRDKIVKKGGDPLRETLTVIPTLDGKSVLRTGEGDFWRAYVFIEKATTHDVVSNLEMVYEASKAFGLFQKDVADLPGGRLHETIVNFHHTRSRFEAFQASLKRDAKKRASSVRKEIAFAEKRASDASRLVDLLEKGVLPERVTHNDTKLNNVMMDDATGKGICVIDLDTVMPGLPMYDFGDSVRIGASTAAEDERDLARVDFSLDMFDCLARGYLETASGFLTKAEIAELAFSAKLMTLECGMRFLTDHLNGDVYFRIKREGHNLDRCRTQFKMVERMEERMGQMQAVIRKYTDPTPLHRS